MGDRPITGLTRREELALQHGFLVEQEQQAEAQKHGPGGRRKYSKPAQTSRESALEYKKQMEAAGLN